MRAIADLHSDTACGCGQSVLGFLVSRRYCYCTEPFLNARLQICTRTQHDPLTVSEWNGVSVVLMQFGNGCMSNGLREVSPRLSPSLRRADCQGPMHAARSAFNELTHMVLSLWIL